MRQNFLQILILMLLLLASCRKDFTTVLNSGTLTFSKDTVYLDTVFTNIGSSTYNLKVYNKSNKAISIPTVALGRGENSFYRLSVDGKPGKIFQNIEILAKDSLYIFIETTIDYSQISNPIYTDSIVFDSGSKLQNVKLVTLVKDAHFLFPSKNADGVVETVLLGMDSNGDELKINGFYLSDNTTFNNEKPYVIYGYCTIPENKILKVESGANIYFHSNSGLIVSKNATLQVDGSLGNEVVFEGDRLEPEFKNIPGQWGAIWLRAGSKNNAINYAIIKNASIGIICDSVNNNSPTLTIKNTRIYNSSINGILGRETNIKGENIVINNSGQTSLSCTFGGTYNFTHCTFANYWNRSLRQFPSVLINNFYSYMENNKQIVESRDLKVANFTNCIIDGNNQIELILDKATGSLFNYFFRNNMIQFNDVNNSYKDFPEYNFEDTNNFSNNIFNGFPDYKAALNNELMIGNNSEAIEKAAAEGSIRVPLDILGTNRSIPSDIGAYQHTTFN